MKVKLSEFPIQPQTMECCRECTNALKDCIPDPMNCIDFTIANYDFIKSKQKEAETKEATPKNQYCRYCSHCIAQDEEYGVCEKSPRSEMVKKTTIRNSCQDFDFCEIDAFYFNRSDNPEDAKYRPREPKAKQCEGQLALFGGEEP